MSQQPKRPRPPLGRIIYSVLFWIIIYFLGIVVGGAVAWAMGANSNIQIGAGLITGVVLLFIANRWVQRYRGNRP